MASKEIGFTDGGGVYIELTDDDGATRRVELEPTTQGRGKIAFETPDGVRNEGEIEPGKGSERGVGR